MAVLCWMTVTLALLLSAGNGVSAVNQNELSEIVGQMLNRFTPTQNGRIPPMFSVAVSIPYNERKVFDISQVTDDSGQVRHEVDNCRVYTSARVVEATVLRWDNVLTQCPNEPVQWGDVVRKCGGQPLSWDALGRMLRSGRASPQCVDAVQNGRADHAEYRILQNFNTLVTNRNPNDLLVFYVRATPCSNRCTRIGGHWSILQSIREITNWRNHAVVFSDIFQPRSGPAITPEVHREALERLGGSVGATNIYRCRRGNPVQCATCSDNGRVPDYCVTDNVPFGTSNNLPSTSLTQPQRGRRKSPSLPSLSDTEGRNTEADRNIRQRQGSSGSWHEVGRKSRGRGQNRKNIMQSESFSSSESDTEYPNTNVGSNAGTQGGRRRRRKGKKKGNTNVDVSSTQGGIEGPNTEVSSNTGGGQGGRGRRRKGKKKGQTNEGECVSSSQSGSRQACSSGPNQRARRCCLVCAGVCALCCVVCPLILPTCLQYLGTSGIV
ncbi:uncharacterized protein [Pempheris klunzingeri]|uniref:uncharacterized protein n=1 Tax=Pempheris klunzingeri TaxID=3127111 RepID=UPI00398069D1